MTGHSADKKPFLRYDVLARIDPEGSLMTAAGFDRITVDPQQMNGQPCIRGMRMTVRRVVEAVTLYPARSEFFREYPELKEDDVKQALEFAREV